MKVVHGNLVALAVFVAVTNSQPSGGGVRRTDVRGGDQEGLMHEPIKPNQSWKKFGCGTARMWAVAVGSLG